ncbi:MAG TPA: ribonuclease HI [Hyphomonadaceae bacterium]|nr:ribonuclease HI [Hyphomonadaceae bacterium]HPN04463.1 ribonuclease HI [Hyphomonadaceae bacterium]
MTDIIEIWTDGACSGNPGPGGWGAVIRTNGVDTELHGGEPATTNNRMELMAAIASLEHHAPGTKLTLHTDSTYVKDGLTKWIIGWKRNGWKTADKKPVKNQDLWMRLEAAASAHKVDWRWVKGHSGHKENDRADALARLGCDENRQRR